MYFVSTVSIHHAMCLLDFQFENLIFEINKIRQKSQELNCIPYILFLDVTEGRVYDTHNTNTFLKIYEIINSFNIEYCIAVDEEAKHLSLLPELPNVFYSDFLVIPSYIHSHEYEDQQINVEWNYLSNKGLYIPGHLERPHRILLMAKFWEKQLLNKLNWSFYCTNNSRPKLREMLSSYDQQTFDKFILECTRSLDLNFNTENLDFFMCNGYPFDVNIYRDTSFSVISESDFIGGSVPKITEKTYRTIINRHPFICSWYPGMIEKLKEKGYRTFNEYALIPHYNDIPELNSRLEATVKNINFFFNTLTKKNRIEKIKDDINHNYTHYVNCYKNEIKKFDHVFRLPQSPHEKFTQKKLVELSLPRYLHILNHK